LLKTFGTGAGGWADKQFPDGTITWTSPSGRTYTTKPGGALFFPILATPTGEATIRKLTTTPPEARGLTMPRRKRTRAQEQDDRIAAERRINEARIAEERRKHQAWLAATYEPHRSSLDRDIPRCLSLRVIVRAVHPSRPQLPG
jgi:hypothetical protein